MLGKRMSRGRAFTMCHAVVLLAFIGMGQFIGPAAQATDTRVSKIEKTFSNTLFEGARATIRVRAAFHDDGLVVMSGPLGVYHGTWREFAGEVCLDFDNGPRAGFSCTGVMKVAEGRFETEDGVLLQRIASIRRF